MLEYIKNYGDSVARENICLNSTAVVAPPPDGCSPNSLKSSITLAASHERSPGRKAGTWEVQCTLCPPVKFSS